jgi:hypothetical protein
MAARVLLDVSEVACHRRPGDGRALTGQHDDDCTDLKCRGCQTCPEPHCGVCGNEHATNAHPLTCAGCVGEVREDLAVVVELSRHLWDQAVNGGNEGRLLAAAPIPGGDPLVLVSPGGWGLGQFRQMVHRLGHTDAGGEPAPLDVSHLDDERASDPEPPLLVLASLEEMWRSILGQPQATERATIRRAAAYLNQNLTWAAQRRDIDMLEFVSTLRGLRSRLENTLVDGERLSKGVECFGCGRVLTRAYHPPRPCRHVAEAKAQGITAAAWIRTVETYPELVPRKIRAKHDIRSEHALCKQGGLSEPDVTTGWECRTCKRQYTAGDYARAVMHQTSNAQGWVTAVLASQATGRPIRTVHSWIYRRKVPACCELRTHALMVWWPDVRRQHLRTFISRLVA